MAGTAAATQVISSASFVYARAMEVFNLTNRNIEVIIGVDGGTADYTPGTISGTPVMMGKPPNTKFFAPGTSSSTGSGRAQRFACEFQQGMQMWFRTTENTPITCSSVLPFIINFWA